ncbi:hypothetical protein GBF38_016113 [Nibea albiflora]|uniref:Uncharacterized protein n=1 Tax=Nibea albiflora TaxID=240163 RepID=A0ACB7FIE1_NIBAL|nr:hypothetical protein GBF38_016113 [Nibea albiflora]
MSHPPCPPPSFSFSFLTKASSSPFESRAELSKSLIRLQIATPCEEGDINTVQGWGRERSEGVSSTPTRLSSTKNSSSRLVSGNAKKKKKVTIIHFTSAGTRGSCGGNKSKGIFTWCVDFNSRVWRRKTYGVPRRHSLPAIDLRL